MQQHIVVQVTSTASSWHRRNCERQLREKKYSRMLKTNRIAVALKDLCASHRSDHAALDAGASYIPPTDAEMLTWRSGRAAAAGVAAVLPDEVLNEAYTDYLGGHDLLCTRYKISATAAKVVQKRTATKHKFMKIFVKYYIHPTYEETRVMVQRRSDFFFRHHQADFDCVPRGIYLRTCVQGELQAATVPRHRTVGGSYSHQNVVPADDCVLQARMRPEFGYTSAHSGANLPRHIMLFAHEAEYAQGGPWLSPEITQNVPPIVQPTMDSILHLVRIATSHVTLYLEMCTHPWIMQHMYPGMLPVPGAIEGRLSIRDILRELVYIINNNLCGRFQASLASHAADMQYILSTPTLQESDVQFLLAILDDFEVRIAGRFYVGNRSCL